VLVIKHPPPGSTLTVRVAEDPAQAVNDEGAGPPARPSMPSRTWSAATSTPSSWGCADGWNRATASAVTGIVRAG